MNMVGDKNEAIVSEHKIMRFARIFVFCRWGKDNMGQLKLVFFTQCSVISQISCDVWPFVIYVRPIINALNCFLMLRRRVTIKDVRVYTMLE